MKIEVAESLCLSWLRHVRDCRIAQLNWKPSVRWETTNRTRVETLFTRSREFFLSRNIDLYKKTDSVSQLLKQAEIDAVGICDFGERPSVIAIDVAFHEGGLNYGSKSETVARVFKKIVRTLLVLESYFAGFSYEIIFATPKLNKATHDALSTAMLATYEFLDENEISADACVIANDEFFEVMLQPVLELSSQVADTSELFVRSCQLMKMVPSTKRIVTQKDDHAASIELRPDQEILGIGKLVQRKFTKLLQDGTLAEPMIADLNTIDYSRKVFGLRYPALKPANDPKDRFDEKGHARYYSNVIADRYLLCNDWYERHRERFNKWLANVKRNEN